MASWEEYERVLQLRRDVSSEAVACDERVLELSWVVSSRLQSVTGEVSQRSCRRLPLWRLPSTVMEVASLHSREMVHHRGRLAISCDCLQCLASLEMRCDRSFCSQVVAGRDPGAGSSPRWGLTLLHRRHLLVAFGALFEGHMPVIGGSPSSTSAIYSATVSSSEALVGCPPLERRLSTFQ